MERLNDAWSRVATFVPQFAAFLVILLVGWVIAMVLAKVVNGALERIGFDRWVKIPGSRPSDLRICGGRWRI